MEVIIKDQKYSLEPVGAGNDASSSSSSSSSRNMVQSKSKALEGLHLPSSVYPRRGPNDPYFAFVITNSKTFELAFGSKNQDKKAVVHSLRLHDEDGYKKGVNHSPEKYNFKLDKEYAERIQIIAPGLSYDVDPKFRKDQYEKHGYLTNLGQVQYFENIIILFKHINPSLPVARHLHVHKKAYTQGRRSSYHEEPKVHTWSLLDINSVKNYFLTKFGVYAGLTYIRDKNGVKYLYEYKFYFNTEFKMVNAPKGEQENYIDINFEPQFKTKNSGHKKKESTDYDDNNVGTGF